MHRLKSRGVCSHTIFTHTSAQSVVIKKRWHLGWIVWEKTVINESAASPHSCTSLSSWFFSPPLPSLPLHSFICSSHAFFLFLNLPLYFSFHLPASASDPLCHLFPLCPHHCALLCLTFFIPYLHSNIYHFHLHPPPSIPSFLFLWQCHNVSLHWASLGFRRSKKESV